MLCLCTALLVSFAYFAFSKTDKTTKALHAFGNFPFWAVCLVYFLSYLYRRIRDSYLFRLARTLHLRHEYRPARPTVNTARPPVVTERDITSATPTSANYFRHV